MTGNAPESGDNVDIDEARQLFEAERWDALVATFPASPHYTPQLDFYRGIAFARLGRWIEAREALELGARKSPTDARFRLELAGVLFKIGDTHRARESLLRALSLPLSPEQAEYANDFLGTIFYLDENIEASLKYWNRLNKPQVRHIEILGQPRLLPDILDGSLAVSSFELLTLESLRMSRASLASLGIFPRVRFELRPRETEFDLRLLLAERNGLGSTKLQALLSIIKGVPFATAYLDLYNLGHRALNSRSLFRWDANKRRVDTTFEGPIGRNPRQRFELNVDARIENWELTRVDLDDGTDIASFGLDAIGGGWRVGFQQTGRSRWYFGGSAVRRVFEDVAFEGESPYLFADGTSVQFELGAEHLLLSLPERQIDVRARARVAVGGLVGLDAPMFRQVRADLTTRWLSDTRNELVTTRVNAGSTSEAVPLDKLFLVGIERDNDLWLRAHRGTFDGKKGSAFMGRHFFLVNADFEKTVVEHAWFSLGLGPFVDVGIVSDESMGLGSRGWVVDAGLQVKFRVTAGSSVLLSYGRDLRGGNNVLYFRYAR